MSPESPELFDRYSEQRILNDAELLKGGAVMNMGRLVLTADQIDVIRNEANAIHVTDDTLVGDAEQNVENPEKDSDREKLLTDIVEFARGSLFGSATFIQGISKKASILANKNGRRSFNASPGIVQFGDLDRHIRLNDKNAITLREDGRDNDRVEFKFVEKSIYGNKTEDVTQTTKNKFFGKKTETVQRTKRVVTGFKKVAYNELFGGDVDESAVEVQFELRTLKRIDMFGRKGGFYLGFILPKSVAITLRDELYTEPDLVEDIVKNVLADYGFDPEEAWTNVPVTASENS
jgi:hypothetical protein